MLRLLALAGPLFATPAAAGAPVEAAGGQLQALCRAASLAVPALAVLVLVWCWTRATRRRARRRLDDLAAELARRDAVAAQLRESCSRTEAASHANAESFAMLGHEIRTPLNGVIGATDLLLDSSLTPGQRQDVETIRACGDHLLAIISGILDFAKIEAGRLELEAIAFDLREVVTMAVRLVGAQAQAKGLALTCDLGPDVPSWVVGDPTRLRQILLNLLGNAVKFTETGAVAVRVGVAERDAAGALLHFEVEDTGIGIAPERQGDLFEAFTQADAATARLHGGTGLGLAICRRLARLMGGEIGVASAPGEGATFWFTVRLGLVAAAEAGDGSDPTLLPPEAKPPAGLRVLLVEDDAIDQRVIARQLEQLGCSVAVALDGRSAVAACLGDAFDLLLMDCRMPEMDGLEATREIRRREGAGRRTPIVALTASAGSADRERCLAAGMDAHLAKPARRADIARALARWARAANPQRVGLGT